MLWVLRTLWCSLAYSVHLLADASQSSCIGVSWSPGLSRVDGALLDWLLYTISSLFGDPAVDVLDLVLLQGKLGQVLPERVCVHLLQFLGMSRHGSRVGLGLVGG